MTSATDFNITTEIKRIEKKKTNYGVLGKMDEVLRLAKRGYDYAMIEYALNHFAKGIKNATARDIALDAYLRRVK